MIRIDEAPAAIALGCTVLGAGLAGCGTEPAQDVEESVNEVVDEVKEGVDDVDLLVFTGTRSMEVDGRSVEVSCSGDPSEDGPVVVLVHGGGDSLEELADFQEALGEEHRTCSYDRPGAGASDAPDEAQTFADSGEVLTAVIEGLAGGEPVVLAGHSQGGLIAGRYAPDHPDMVAGLILMDATSPTQQADLTEEVPASAEGEAADLRDQTLAVLQGENPELLEMPDGEVEPAGDMPVEVVEHGEQYLAAIPEYGPGLEEAWAQGQRRWLDLSDTSTLTTAENSGHHIYLDEPDVAAEAVRRVRDQASGQA